MAATRRVSTSLSPERGTVPGYSLETVALLRYAIRMPSPLRVPNTLASAWIVSLAAFGSASCGKEPPAGRFKHVVLVVVDTLRADRLGCYGYPRDTSPNIDALAARGTRYADARPQGSVTIASMISMMTGLYVTHREEVLPRYARTLAERVADTGRRTAAFAGNQNLTGDRGFQRGFDTFEPIHGGRGRHIVKAYGEWLRANIDSVRRDGSFVWLHMMDPHAPYKPMPEHRERFLTTRHDVRELVASWRRDLQEGGRIVGSTPDPATVNAAFARMIEVHSLYDAEVASADAAVGQLVELLRDTGLERDTLVIFASDHGEELYEQLRYPEELRMELSRGELAHPEKYFANGHGWSFRETAWRTPLIVVGEGLPRGHVEETLTANLDLFPTILEAVGVEPTPELPGQSLLDGPPRGRSHVLAYTNEMIAVKDKDGSKYVDRTDRLARYENLYHDKDGDPDELVDVTAWRGDWKNLAPDRQERVQRYRELIRRWRQEHRRSVDTTVSDADAEALRELGYIGGAAEIER